MPGFEGVPSLLAFLLAASITQSVLFGGLTAGSDTALDIQTGFFDRLLASPVPRTTILVGRLAGASTTGALQAVVFIVVYGLDWVATVPPTVALCRTYFGDRGTIVFGWVFAAHQVGAGIAAFAAGWVRDELGSYSYAWFGGAALCAIAVVLSLALRPHAAPAAEPALVPGPTDPAQPEPEPAR